MTSCCMATWRPWHNSWCIRNIMRRLYNAIFFQNLIYHRDVTQIHSDLNRCSSTSIPIAFCHIFFAFLTQQLFVFVGPYRSDELKSWTVWTATVWNKLFLISNLVNLLSDRTVLCLNGIKIFKPWLTFIHLLVLAVSLWTKENIFV